MEQVDVVVAAARHQVGLLPREELPMLAAEWLVAGLDTPLLRELAGLGRSDGSITWLWPDVLAELGVDLPIADPRRVLTPWAARLVLDGEQETAWLVDCLLRGMPVDDHDDELIPLLYDLDLCLDRIGRPDAVGVRDVAGVLSDAYAERDRIVWLLARQDPGGRPLPPLPRDRALVEAAVGAFRDDLRRITRRRWTLEEDRPEDWVLHSPDRSVRIELTGSLDTNTNTNTDTDALPPDISYENLDQELADEATAHVGGAVQEALDACGAELRCRVHAAPLTICAGLWICDAEPGHDISEVGALRRRDAELHLAE